MHSSMILWYRTGPRRANRIPVSGKTKNKNKGNNPQQHPLVSEDGRRLHTHRELTDVKRKSEVKLDNPMAEPADEKNGLTQHGLLQSAVYEKPRRRTKLLLPEVDW